MVAIDKSPQGFFNVKAQRHRGTRNDQTCRSYSADPAYLVYLILAYSSGSLRLNLFIHNW